jgi:hypothetical protein
MPHLRLEVPEEWLSTTFAKDTGFDAEALIDHLVDVVCGIRMENGAIETRRAEIRSALGNPDADVPESEARRDSSGKAIEPLEVPLINRKNLKHALIPVRHSGVAGDLSKGFLHCTFSAGNDTPGRTAEVRRRAALALGNAIDEFVGDLPGLASVTVHVQDIDRDRGYTTTTERRKLRETGA